MATWPRSLQKQERKLVMDTDTHEPGDLITDDFAHTILLGAGLNDERINVVLRNSRELAARASAAIGK